MTARELWLPLFPVGEYRSSSGTWVTLTPEKLRAMERNTKFVIHSGVLAKPPVGYKHPASSGEARGHIGDVRFENGVLHARIDQPKFIDDVKAGRRLEYSGEFAEELDCVIDGKPQKIGPVVVGTAILGDERPAIKNPKRLTLSSLVFGEGTTPVEAFEIREELRKTGFVSQTLDDEGRYAFSEIAFDPQNFQESTTMTDAEIQAAIQSAVNAAVTPLKTENATLLQKLTDQETKFTERINQFSENSARKAEVHSFCEKVQTPNDKRNPRLTETNMQRFETILMHPAVVKDADLDKALRAFAEGIPPIFVERGGGEGEGGGDDDREEPKALRALKLRHFSEIDDATAQQKVEAGIIALGAFKPDTFKGIENNPQAQTERTRNYIYERDNGTAAN